MDDFSFTRFAPQLVVLDAGCGQGSMLRELRQHGCHAIGIDLDLQALRRSGTACVVQASVERIPIRDAQLDGLVCKVVIPYTDEARVIQEIGRVLKSGAVAYLCYHGAAYYVRYLLCGPTWKRRFYALRTIVNTWYYALSGRHLPGFLGDTAYQSRARLGRYCRDNGLAILEDPPAPTFLSLPVFIYHTLLKVGE